MAAYPYLSAGISTWNTILVVFITDKSIAHDMAQRAFIHTNFIRLFQPVQVFPTGFLMDYI